MGQDNGSKVEGRKEGKERRGMECETRKGNEGRKRTN